jgi:acetyl-CoA synthetase
MKEGRDIWLQPLLDGASDNSVAEIMDSEDPLFIYIPGSTGKPKGMVHTTAGYMVYTAYTFKNVFNYEENDIFGVLILVGLQVILIFCMALIERSNNSDFEGVPSYPDFSRFGKLSKT